LKKNERNVTFGDNDSISIVGKGILNLENGKNKVGKVMCVENMKTNILSVIQMCDQGHNIVFNS
jgi:hypothetical protein